MVDLLWIRKRIDECGITVAALQHAFAEDVDQTRYQDAFGNCWSGEGAKKQETAQSAPSASTAYYSHRIETRV
ncbi:hypothetical protein [Paraburkholderia solitsugae]|uniref:hypothetical protein n=1 Tax=Paraburkholderia solitsugae TaxID=2675748 RepID=UPI001C130D58|nr:hypothetical protein [Paraburkholderia solitsugae]